MWQYRPANTRGTMKKSWIESRRTFSNNDYWNSKYMNWGDLQVINDDVLQPGALVPNHEHNNMEIFGYVVDGPCDHVDNLGNKASVPSGAIQRMSAGSSIWHTEGNSSTEPIRYLQLWIQPLVENTRPEWMWRQFTREDKLNKFCDITASIPIKQDARLLSGIFTEPFTYELNPQRRYYMYVVKGTVTVEHLKMREGDGLACRKETALQVTEADCEIILFDLR